MANDTKYIFTGQRLVYSKHFSTHISLLSENLFLRKLSNRKVQTKPIRVDEIL